MFSGYFKDTLVGLVGLVGLMGLGGLVGLMDWMMDGYGEPGGPVGSSWAVGLVFKWKYGLCDPKLLTMIPKSSMV